MRVYKVYGFRAIQMEISDILDLPIPFQYFHIMSLMLMVNCTLWSYGMGTYPSYISSVIFFCALLIFMGMRELAAALADPFGEDEVDFPINMWMNEAIRNVQQQLEYEFDLEEELAKEHSSLIELIGTQGVNLFLDDGLTIEQKKDQLREHILLAYCGSSHGCGNQLMVAARLSEFS